MSPPPRPALHVAVLSIARLALVRMWRGRSLKLASAITLLIVVAGIAVRFAADLRPTDVEKAVLEVVFLLLVYVIPVILASGAIADEIDTRTLTYLLVRPVSRPAVTLGKYAAAAAGTSGLLVAAVVVLHVGLFVNHPADLVDHIELPARAAGAVALLGLAYSGIGLLFGALVSEAPGILTAIWLLFFELAAGVIPGPFRLVSMNHHAKNIAGLVESGGLGQWTPAVGAGISAGVIAGLAVVWVLLAVVVVRYSEFRFGRA